jgi:tetratricopeptide (TPR) repeat protein
MTGAFVFLILHLLFVSSTFAQTDAQFAKANQDYAQGDFKGAIAGYQTLIRGQEWSANLFYNLGNAYFRTQDFGHAILSYERALTLDRHHPESDANLRIARDEARALEMQPGWVERHLQLGSVSQYSIAAAVAFWVGMFCFVYSRFVRQHSLARRTLIILSLAVFGVSVFAIYKIDNGQRGAAVVTGNDVQARLATADSAGSVLALPQGSDVRILSTRGDWVYAELPNNLRGWVPAKDTERVEL